MLKMPEYRLSPAAQRDLADIWRYTNKQWGKEQANRYTLGIGAICAKLAEARSRGRTVSISGQATGAARPSIT